MLFINTIIAIQLALNVQAWTPSRDTYSAEFFQRNDKHIQRLDPCRSANYRRTGPRVFVCGSQGTTVTLDGITVTLKAPKTDSQVTY